MADKLRKLTRKELEEFNGKGGKLAYIAYKGKVYDVSESPFWLDGEHMGMHQAGKDLTEELEIAPHKDGVLEMLSSICMHKHQHPQRKLPSSPTILVAGIVRKPFPQPMSMKTMTERKPIHFDMISRIHGKLIAVAACILID